MTRYRLRALSWIVTAWAAITCLSACKGQETRYANQADIVAKVTYFTKARDSAEKFQKRWKADADRIQALSNGITQQLVAKQTDTKSTDSLRAEYDRVASEYQRFVRVNTEREMGLQNELMAPQVEKVNRCLDEFLKKNKIQILLGTQQGGVILAAEKSLDWTEKVITFLNQECK